MRGNFLTAEAAEMPRRKRRECVENFSPPKGTSRLLSVLSNAVAVADLPRLAYL
jgi:hypothetical protein